MNKRHQQEYERATPEPYPVESQYQIDAPPFGKFLLVIGICISPLIAIILIFNFLA